jgi:hypothetical protein
VRGREGVERLLSKIRVRNRLCIGELEALEAYINPIEDRLSKKSTNDKRYDPISLFGVEEGTGAE